VSVSKTCSGDAPAGACEHEPKKDVKRRAEMIAKFINNLIIDCILPFDAINGSGVRRRDISMFGLGLSHLHE
jgi:hypothetical protein